MKQLKQRMKTLYISSNPQERLMFQITDWNIIKYKLKDEADDEILRAFDKVIEGFIWLYEKDLSMALNLENILTGEELSQYEEYLQSFSKVQDFIRTRISLLGDYFG